MPPGKKTLASSAPTTKKPAAAKPPPAAKAKQPPATAKPKKAAAAKDALNPNGCAHRVLKRKPKAPVEEKEDEEEPLKKKRKVTPARRKKEAVKTKARKKGRAGIDVSTLFELDPEHLAEERAALGEAPVSSPLFVSLLIIFL